jgi:hypothetical protein
MELEDRGDADQDKKGPFGLGYVLAFKVQKEKKGKASWRPWDERSTAALVDNSHRINILESIALYSC